MRELIEIFKMTEISVETRCRLIIKAGELINNQYAANATEPVVYELLMLLDPKHPRLADIYFQSLAGVYPKKVSPGESK